MEVDQEVSKQEMEINESDFLISPISTKRKKWLTKKDWSSNRNGNSDENSSEAHTRDLMQGSRHLGGGGVISVLQPKKLRLQVVKSLAQTRSWLGRSGVSSLCALCILKGAEVSLCGFIFYYFLREHWTFWWTGNYIQMQIFILWVWLILFDETLFSEQLWIHNKLHDNLKYFANTDTVYLKLKAFSRE